MKKLGVWNKDFGFKVIVIPGIDNVADNVLATDEYLFVSGYNQERTQCKTAVISLANGYWGERA
jgi:hypothetical protein